MDELLAGYAAGSLAGGDRDRVRAHLPGCARCRESLAAWRAIAAGGAPADSPPDPDRLVREVLTRSALDPVAGPDAPGARPARRLRYVAALVVAEARLIRLAVPVASALVMALGVVVILIRPAAGGADGGPVIGSAGDVLALIAPIVAAAGVAGVYRSRHDPAAELVAAAPTSGRLLLLVRLTLVLGYDLALALAASAVLAATADPVAGLDVLIGAWLGPMALLCSLSLLLAVWFGPDVALAAAVGLWALRVLAGGILARDGWSARLIMEAWSTNAVVLVVSAAVGIVAVAAAGRSGPFASEPGGGPRATHPL